MIDLFAFVSAFHSAAKLIEHITETVLRILRRRFVLGVFFLRIRRRMVRYQSLMLVEQRPYFKSIPLVLGIFVGDLTVTVGKIPNIVFKYDHSRNADDTGNKHHYKYF